MMSRTRRNTVVQLVRQLMFQALAVMISMELLSGTATPGYKAGLQDIS